MVDINSIESNIESWLGDNPNPQFKAIKFKQLLDILDNYESANGIIKNVEDNNLKLADEITQANNINKEITHKIAELENRIDLRKTILEDEEKLNEKMGELSNLLDRIKVLELKKETIEKPQNEVNLLKTNINTLKGEIEDKLKEYVDTLNPVIDILEESKGDLENELKSKLKNVRENLEILSNKQNEILKTVDTSSMKTRFLEFNSIVEALIQEHNEYVDKINSIKKELAEVEIKHAQIIDSFKEHGFENEKIYGKLKKLSGEDGVGSYIEKISSDIKEKLNDFDNHIRELIKNREEIPVYERLTRG